MTQGTTKGVPIDTDPTMALNSNQVVPSQAAVVSYLANQVGAIPITLAKGGTSANLTASNGGIFYSTAGAGAILAGTATAGQMLQSGSSAAPSWSTTTYPATNAVNTLLYASSANVIGELATANNGVLVTGNTGVPAILAGPGVAGKILQSNAAAAPSYSTSTYPNIATGTGTILRADGTNWVATTATYPTTTNVSEILYSSSANAVTGLTTGNDGVLITSHTGVPSLLANGTTGQFLTATTGAPPSWITGNVIAQTVFDSSGTWTKAAGVTQVLVLMWNGGSSGGSGRRGATTAAGGGGGGTNGFGLYWFGLASFFGTSTTVTIGNGGNGGAAITVDNTSGNPGIVGGQTILGNLTPVAASTATVALGGTTTSAAGAAVAGWRVYTLNTPLIPAVNAGIVGGAGGNVTGTTSAALGGVANMFFIPSGGGGGSGGDSGTARQAGNGGLIQNSGSTTLVAGGAGGISSGTINGAPGNIGLQTGGTITGGSGGGGGGGMVAGTAGTGGVGGVPGGGGGGGGGSINGTNSGAGGNGGKGRIIIIEYS